MVLSPHLPFLQKPKTWQVTDGGRELPSLVWWRSKSQQCLLLWLPFQMFSIINHYGEKLVKNIEKKVAADEFLAIKE